MTDEEKRAIYKALLNYKLKQQILKPQQPIIVKIKLL